MAQAQAWAIADQAQPPVLHLVAVPHKYLVGKIISDWKPSRRAVIGKLAGIWSGRGVLRIQQVEEAESTFIITFTRSADRDLVFNGGIPWTVSGHLVALQKWDGFGHPDDLNFDTVALGLEIHGIPITYRHFNAVRAVTSIFDGLLWYDSSALASTDWSNKVIKAVVGVRVNDPLPPGLEIGTTTNSIHKLGISFKYEKIVELCYYCGRLGHLENHCRWKEHDIATTGGPVIPKVKFGPEMMVPDKLPRPGGDIFPAAGPNGLAHLIRIWAETGVGLGSRKRKCGGGRGLFVVLGSPAKANRKPFIAKRKRKQTAGKPSPIPTETEN